MEDFGPSIVTIVIGLAAIFAAQLMRRRSKELAHARNVALNRRIVIVASVGGAIAMVLGIVLAFVPIGR